MSLFFFLRRRPKPDQEVASKQLSDTLADAKRSADETVRQIVKASGISEEEVKSETRRLVENRPPRPGDLLRDLVHRANNDRQWRGR